MLSDYPTSAKVIIALLILACLVLAFFVCKYYKLFDYYLDEFIEHANESDRRRVEIRVLERKLKELEEE